MQPSGQTVVGRRGIDVMSRWRVMTMWSLPSRMANSNSLGCDTYTVEAAASEFWSKWRLVLESVISCMQLCCETINFVAAHASCGFKLMIPLPPIASRLQLQSINIVHSAARAGLHLVHPDFRTPNQQQISSHHFQASIHISHTPPLHFSVITMVSMLAAVAFAKL